MELVSPNPGTVFWMVFIFGIVFLILKRFAWKPILNALREREMSIGNALLAADIARQQMDSFKADQEALIASTLRDKDLILREALDIKEKIIAEAKIIAGQEGDKMIARVKEQIENEKQAALSGIKQQIAELSVQIAEKILQEKLKSTPVQEKLIQIQLEEFKLN